MTTFMTYKEECEALRQRVAGYKLAINVLQEQCRDYQEQAEIDAELIKSDGKEIHFLRENLAVSQQRVAELESIVEKSIDDGIDKILAMSDDQITALAAFGGSNPRDKETIAKQCMDIAVANVQINELIAERDALKQQRDGLLAAAEQVCHANNLTEAQIAVRVLNTVIASVKEKA